MVVLISSMKKSPQIESSKNKTCFLITPIGSIGDETRNRVDQWMKLIYQPALGKNYKIIRSDKYQVPGVITEQIVQLIIEADLVLVDFTGFNPNVMYESGIRHLAEKPAIHIHKQDERFPFDIKNLRSISYDPKDLNYPKLLLQSIKDSLKSVESPGYKSPSLVKERFDFNKIIDDPVKFVDLLKKHIVSSDSGFTKHGVGIVEVNDGPVYLSTGMSTPGADLAYRPSGRIAKCPKCGTRTEFDPIFAGSLLPQHGLETVLYGNYHYKCTVCGNEFE